MKIALLILMAVLIMGNSIARAEDKPMDSKDLKSTTITAQMEESIKSGRNLIFCSTFQLAWNELTGKIIKGDLHMVKEPPLVAILNKMRKIITGKDLSEKSYLAMVGFGRDNIVGKINQALTRKFGKEAWLVKEKLNLDDILAYSFLMKNLKFKVMFDDSPAGMSFRPETGAGMVKAFGIKSFDAKDEKMQKLSKQVDVLYYDGGKGEFAVRLNSESDGDELVLARINPGENLMKTYQKAAGLSVNKAGKLVQNDILWIPEINFFIEHSYQELLNKKLLNKGFGDYFISKALQTTKFKLDKTGAYLKSKAVIVVTRSAARPRNVRRFIFNQPFLLYMKEKNAKNPYFVMWIDNPEVLVKK